jgi:hypothetical protein
MKTPAFMPEEEIHETDEPSTPPELEITSGIRENARIVVTKVIATT